MTATDDTAQPPSKSARKRAAQAAQDLGEALVRLRDAELDALQLPEALSEAIRAALAAHSARAAREAERFKRISAWRERLIAEGATALAELARWRPDIDRAQWARRVSAAQAERARAAGAGAAARELFRALRALFDTMP